jgi:pimeloyl-ACP methyl ester carboxylesterase
LRVILGALIAVGALAAIFGLAVFAMQAKLVFKPTKTLLLEPSDLSLPFENIELPLANGARVHGWFVPREGSRRLVLCLPGSIGNMSHEAKTVAFFRDLGANVFIVDYPGHGKSSGRPSESGCYLTADAAWEFATREKGFAPENIALFGRSLGGTVAARLAARHPECGRLMLHSGVTNVPDVAARRYPFFPVRYFCFIRFNTLRQIRDCKCPILIMHPAADSVIPIRHGERIFAAAPEPKRFLPLRGDHYDSDWLTTPGLRAALEEWM